MKLFGYENPKYSSIIPLIGYVPQKVTFEPNFPATVYDVVAMGIISEKRIVQGAINSRMWLLLEQSIPINKKGRG